MRTVRILVCGLLLFGVVIWHAAAQPPAATLFEGARLIVGDGSAPIENSAFLVENNHFTKIGKKGTLQAPGTARADLTGKTVIPGIVNAHNHLGWGIIQTGKIGKDTFSREKIVDHP